jgi:hypothetical protein
MNSSPTELKFKVAVGRARFLVTFYLGKGYLNADCNCPAGQYGNFCQHRIKLLRGDGSQIVSDNLDDLVKVVNALPGTGLESALVEFEVHAGRVTELRPKGPSHELDKAETEFKAARRNLSAMMMA